MQNKYQILYIESSNSVALRFPYNEVLGKRFYGLGFKYDKAHRYYVKKFKPSMLPFLLGLPGRWTRSDNFKKLLDENRDYLRIYHLKNSKTKFAPDSEIYYKYNLIPKSHQIKNLKFIYLNNGKCLINDEQGTGKSLCALIYCNESKIKTYILCPSFLEQNWRSEIEKTLPESARGNFFVHSFDKEIELDKEEYNLIIDESHNIRKLNSKRFKNCSKFAKESKSTILLTGHDFNQDPESFYIQIKLLGLDITKKRFMNKYFITSFENMQTRILGCRRELMFLDFYKYTSRTSLDEVRGELKAINQTLNIQLTPGQRKELDTLVKNDSLFFTASTVSKIMLQCSLFKIPILEKYINNELKISGQNIVIFTQFEEIALILNKLFKFSQVYDPKYPASPQVLLVNSSKYREGIDLSKYSKLVLLDFFADKNKNLQIKRRINRIGQMSSEISCVYVLANHIDSVLYKMPTINNYEKALQYIKERLLKKESKKAA